jgi:Flp pilus assembly protein TadD
MRFLIAMSILAVNSSAADPRWIRLQTDSFEIYSTASENNTREALRQFEEVRSFFPRTGTEESKKSARVRIVAFNSQKEFEPYRFNEFATAYYQKSAERDTIVMSHLGPETSPTAIHEYVHLVAQHAGLKAPPWFNEGLAELYSTLRPLGSKTVVGDLIPGRMQALLRDKWVPLAVILAADQDSPYYNEKNKAGSLYNEGWALTHMLVLSEDYRPHLDDFMRALMQGKDSIEALTSVYGKPLAAIEKDLLAYLRGDRFRSLVYATRLDQSKLQVAAEPAPMFEVRLMLVDLTDKPGKEAATREALEKLAAEAPAQPEPHTQLGYLVWRSGDGAQAQKEFEKSYALGGRSARMLWDYGRMIESRDPKQAISVFQDLLEQEPARSDVRIELASALYNDNQAGEALKVLAKLPGVSYDEAPRYYSLAAYVALKLGDRKQAKALAEMLMNAKKATPGDKQRAQQLLAFLNQPERPAPAAAVRMPANDDGAPPVLRRQSPAGEVDAAPVRQLKIRLGQASLSGKLVEFVCGDSPKLIVETSAGKKTLLIERPDRIVVTGREDGRAEMECGVQKPAALVEVEYDQPGAGMAVDGLVRAVTFGAAP